MRGETDELGASKHWMKRLTYLGLVLMLGAALTACGGPGSGEEAGGTGPAPQDTDAEESAGDAGDDDGETADGEPIRLGLAIAQTGRLSDSAASMLNSYRLWEQTVNDAGGIAGQPVELVVYDDESDPDTARVLAERLVQQDDVLLMLGPYGSGSTATMAIVAERDQVPLLGTIASDTAIWTNQDWEWAVQAYPGAASDHTGFLEIAADNGVDRVALVVENTAFVKEGAAHARDVTAPELGISIDEFEWSQDDLDFSSILERVSSGDYSAVSVMGYLPGAISFGEAMVERGLQVDGILLATPDETVVDALGEDVTGAFARTPWHETLATEGNQEFVSAYEEEYGRAPDYQAATAWASGQLVQQAIESAGTDRQAIMEFLRTNTADTVFGTYEVDERGIQVGYQNVTGQWRDAETFVIVRGEGATEDATWPKPDW